jgi:leader peptidase (prepilin peptidase)/N-methyltransferase
MPLLTLASHEGLILAALLGLLIGSFVNVVIDRLPVILERRWQEDALAMSPGLAEAHPDLPERSGEEKEAHAPLNLLTPGSHCLHCKTRLGVTELIPVVSWLLQRGRCRHCGSAIGLRTPLVEAGLASLFAFAAWRFGLGFPGFCAMALLGTLMAAAVIDLETRLLPDMLTLPLLWVGLLLNIQGIFTTIDAAVIGAATGYSSLWSINRLYRLISGRDGMGQGDFKLFAALGAWFGWAALPAILILASAAGALFGLLALALARQRQGEPIAFGPWLALAALPVLFDLLPDGIILPN